MKTNPLRMIAASLLLALFMPQMATAAEAQFTDDNWVIGTPATAPACCIGEVHALVTDADGNLYAGGPFLFDGSAEGGNVARWDGSEWSPLGAGMNGGVRALAFSGNDLYAAGSFTSAGGMTANNIARWDGRAWSALGAGVDSSVSALAVLGDDLYAVVSSSFSPPAPYIAKWDGHEWSRLDSIMVRAGSVAASVNALAVSGSDLYVAGQFTSIGGVAANHIAKWDGSTWSPLGSGITGGEFTWVSVLEFFGTDLYVGGFFTHAGGVDVENIARWDGHGWSGVGSGIDGVVHALVATGDGLYAGGLTHDGVFGLAVSGRQLYVGGTYGRRRSATLFGGYWNFLARLFLDGVPPLEVADGRATVFFRDIPAGGYLIERTTDLETWEHLATRYAGLTGGIDFLDENTPGASAYYRAVPLEP